MQYNADDVCALRMVCISETKQWFPCRKHDVPFIKAHGTSASANSHAIHDFSSSKEDTHPVDDKRDAMDDKAYDKSTWHVSQKCALHVIQGDP